MAVDLESLLVYSLIIKLSIFYSSSKTLNLAKIIPKFLELFLASTPSNI